MPYDTFSWRKFTVRPSSKINRNGFNSICEHLSNCRLDRIRRFEGTHEIPLKDRLNGGLHSLIQLGYARFNRQADHADRPNGQEAVQPDH